MGIIEAIKSFNTTGEYPVRVTEVSKPSTYLKNRVFQFCIRLLSLIVMLVLIRFTSLDLIVIAATGALFLFGQRLSVPCSRPLALGAWTLVGLGLMGVLYALLLPGPFFRMTIPTINKAIPNSNPFSLWGMSSSGYRLFEVLNDLDLKGYIYYPSTSTTHELEAYFPIYRQENLPPGSSSESIERWQLSKASRDLLDAHMTYLLTDDTWEAWLTQEEYNTLRNPEEYTLIYESPPQDVPRYFLFEARGP